MATGGTGGACMAQHQLDRRIGSSPQLEGARALMHQHFQAIQRRDAAFDSGTQEGRRAVGQVIGEGVWREPVEDIGV